MKLLSIDCGIKNLAFCVIDLDKNTKAFTIDRWEVIDVLNVLEESKKKHDFYETTEQLTAVLHDTFSLDTAFDYVLIENQPVQKNPVMKSVQMVIYSFFLIMKHQFGLETIIRLVSASNKLKILQKPTLLSDQITECKNEYRKKKLTAIEYCKHYLTNVLRDDANLAKLLASKKKDDYADSFLQCVQFIEKNLI